MAGEALPHTCAEARRAGAAFGKEVAVTMGRAILDCPDEGRSEEFVDGLISGAHEQLEAVAIRYRDAGLPLRLELRFRTAFLRALRDRAARDRADLSHPAAMAAGPAH